MFVDAHNLFSDAQAVTVSAASTNVVDLKAARRGAGQPLPIAANVQTAFAAGGAGTLTITLQTDSDEAFGTAVTRWSTRALGLTELEAGDKIELPDIPADADRYARLYYTVTTGPMTAGKIDAGIVLDRQSASYEAIKSQYDAVNA